MKKNKKINIIFPYNSVGGAFRSTYEISNRLKKLGYDVVIYFPFFPLMNGQNTFSLTGFLFFVRGILRSLIRRNKIYWFECDFQIKIVPFLNNFFIRDADIIIANHWITAKPTYDLSFRKGEKYYFIRDNEHWAPHYDKVVQAFNLNMKRLVVAEWIKEHFEEKLNLGVEAVITNGFNFKKFKVENKTFNKKNITISMIYSSHPMKGMGDALVVLEKVFRKYSSVKIILFGFETKPKNLNFKFTYYRGLAGDSVKEIYKKTDIFFCPSLQEGFHNPPSEAMAAKCAVIATSVGSVPYTIKNMKNGISVNPGDVISMEKYFSLLIEDKNLRVSLSETAYETIQNLTWDHSIQKLNKIFST